MDPFEQRRLNDVEGLHWLSRWGWLRTTELGPLLWPGNPTARHQADRLVRSWLARRLVIARELPDGAGRALVLATGGVRLLGEAGIAAASGKDVGQLVAGEWRPPLTWRHDLLAAGVLVDLRRRGYQVLPEAHIRRHAGQLVKVPDGIAYRDGAVIWLEVEAARKSGKNMRELADALCAVADGQAATVLGHRPTHVMVAYQEGAQDDRGHSLGHRARVRAAVAAAARRSVPLVWARCTLRGAAGVGAVVYEQEVVQADRAVAVRRVLDAGGWRPAADGCLVATYGKHEAAVWESEHGWSYQAAGRPAEHAATKEEAILACAGVIAGL